jgi:transcriptional regulator with XRE-family HTH domain
VQDDSTILPVQARLGRNLKAARYRAGLTQQQVAERAGITIGSIAQIENGDSDPDLVVIGALANAVGCAAFELLSLEVLESETSTSGPHDERAWLRSRIAANNVMPAGWLRSLALSIGRWARRASPTN